MRILWVKAGKLLPVDTGGKIRSYNLIKQLCLGNETTLLSYYDGPKDQIYEREINQELPGAMAIPTGRAESSIGQGLNYLRYILSPAPFAVTKFTSSEVRRLIAEYDRQERFDVIVCDFLSASLNFPLPLKTPAVLFQHNVESALWQRQARHEPNPLKRLIFKLEAVKMSRYEEDTLSRFKHIIAVSEHDREIMAKMTDVGRISVVPTGVDLRSYSALLDQNGDRKEPLVLFLGSMDWEANVDGVDYFCSEVWPAIRAAVPEARFRVVGRNPHPRVMRFASDSVEITGGVPSVLEHLSQTSVFVVPLRIGGGTRLKIYEAMAAGKAVVSTSVGAEGLDVHDGEDILLADEKDAFANWVIRLLKDKTLRERLERAAVQLAAQYDWEVVAKRFEETLARVIAGDGKVSDSSRALPLS